MGTYCGYLVRLDWQQGTLQKWRVEKMPGHFATGKKQKFLLGYRTSAWIRSLDLLDFDEIICIYFSFMDTHIYIYLYTYLAIKGVP